MPLQQGCVAGAEQADLAAGVQDLVRELVTPARLREFLLRGARGSRAADLDALAEVIARIGDTARSLNGALRALEVNPLWVNGDQVEALDVLVATGPDGI